MRKKLPQDDDMNKVREDFAARLNAPSNKKLATIVSTEGDRDNSESSAAISKFGPEKLAVYRAKALAVKRTTINDADTEPGLIIVIALRCFHPPLTRQAFTAPNTPTQQRQTPSSASCLGAIPARFSSLDSGHTAPRGD